MNEQRLGRILLGLPLEPLLQILGIVAKNLYGTRLAAFLREAAVAGYGVAGHEGAQKALLEAHGVSSQKMREAADRRRRREDQERHRRQEEVDRQNRLEAFWREHHPDHGPGSHKRAGPGQGNPVGSDKPQGGT